MIADVKVVLEFGPMSVQFNSYVFPLNINADFSSICFTARAKTVLLSGKVIFSIGVLSSS